MLEFPEGYFDSENREGFLVDTTMKTVWAAELEVLNEVACICDKYDLKWYAAYGTLLGAVRHQGFIPWDDDIDIWMLREDYRKLMAVIEKELPDEYIVRGPYARGGCKEYQVYVNNSDSISVEPERLRQFHGCPFYVGIDIFPLDVLPEKSEDVDMQRSVLSCAVLLQQEGTGNELEKNMRTQLRELLKQLRDEYQISIPDRLLLSENRQKLLEELWRAGEKILPERRQTKNTYIAMYLDYLKYEKKYEMSWFENIKYLPFEGFDIPVPGNYDKVLKVIYGDYMVPHQNVAAHDYPCYKKQLEELRKRVAEATEGK